MKNWIRIAALMLALLLFTGVMVACNTENNSETPDTPDTENNGENPDANDPNGGEEEAPTLMDPTKAYILADENRTQYVIIRDDKANANVKSMIDNFRNSFWIKTGADIQVMTDTQRPIAKEILISTMDDRDEPAQELAKLNAPGQKGYRIVTSGEKIVVAATEEYLQEALALLSRAIVQCTNGAWGIEREYVGAMDLPALRWDGALYNVGEGNYAFCLDNAPTTAMRDFSGDMEREGFTLYTENTIGNSQFKTYIKDSIYGNMVVYAMYHPEIKSFRMTFGPMEYLPNATPIAASDQSDPTITQMFMEMVNNGYAFGVNQVISANNGAPGMSYLLQLSDGSFIVIDGGNSDGTVYTAKYDETKGQWIASNEAVKTTDTKRLYDTMWKMKPASHGKIKIAAWFMSHAHGDHMNLARVFMDTYKSSIEIGIVGFNFPNPANDTSHAATIQDFRTKAEKLGAKTWIMHTGQQLFLPGCEIEVMSTVEDFYCAGKIAANATEVDLNNTCVVYRITMGNTSFMVLGDAYPTTGQFMADAYGDALESDIMQLAHHGFNGGVYDLYVAVDPKICFWPCDEYRYQTDSRNIGSQGGSYNFNWYLRNKKWTRGTETGNRVHYTASYMTTINANTGKVVKL